MSEDLKLRILVDGNHFDSEFRNRTDDIPFYDELAGKKPLRILELGIGTGRISIPLAQNGHAVTGVDFSSSMLEKTKQKSERLGVSIDLIRSDIADFDSDLKFDLVLSPFNTLMHFSKETISKVLGRVRNALAPQGRFILDVSNPTRYADKAKIEGNTYSTSYPSPDSEGNVYVSTEVSLHENQIDIIRSFMSESRTLLSKEYMKMYYFQVDEWVQLLNGAGFKILNTYGSYDRSEYSHSSSCYLVECQVRD